MSELKWNWVYYPYLDAPNKQEESALEAGYIKVVDKSEADKVINELKEERRWRKCSDEMPEEDETVLFSDGNYIHLGCWTMWDGGCSDYSYETLSGWVESGSEEDHDFNEIKYWMPLPSAPKEENE